MPVFKPAVRLGPAEKTVQLSQLAGHTTSPAVTDWDRDGVPELLVGAKDGRFYAPANPRRANRTASAGSRATGEGSQ
jgi:hypothetical protein